MISVALHGIQVMEPRGLLFPATVRTSPNPKQFGKALLPTDVTDTGRSTLSRLRHDAKLLSPIVTTESDNVIDTRARHEAKALCPMLVTALPIRTDVNRRLVRKVPD